MCFFLLQIGVIFNNCHFQPHLGHHDARNTYRNLCIRCSILAINHTGGVGKILLKFQLCASLNSVQCLYSFTANNLSESHFFTGIL